MKIGVVLSFMLIMSSAIAGVDVNLQCEVQEKAKGIKTKFKTDLVNLSSEGEQTVALTPIMSMDRAGMFLIALSKGNIYSDALGDEVGADYYLTLTRIQNRMKLLKTKKLRGKTQDLLTIIEKEGFVEATSYRKDNGRIINKLPDALKLNYSVNGKKNISVKCEIIN